MQMKPYNIQKKKRYENKSYLTSKQCLGCLTVEKIYVDGYSDGAITLGVSLQEDMTKLM